MDQIDEGSLFGNLEGGELTEEQFEKFKELQIQCGNLVCNDDEMYSDEEEEEEDDEDEEESDKDDFSLSSYTGQTKTFSTDNLSDSDTCASNSVLFSKRDQDLTNKYLNGELTFTQYSTLAENIGNDEIDDDDDDVSKEPIEETADQVIEDMDLQQKTKRRHKRNKLPRDLKGLLGEANLCFARRETENAIKMCMEIIRLAPKAPEPFQTLGMVYEELGNMDKSLQYSLIAAFLGPNDPEEWIKLAEMSLELADPIQAITCYTNALKSDPNNIPVHWERCMLFEQLGKKKKALEGYQQILKIMKPDQATQCWQLAREICKTYHEMGEPKQAITAMSIVFDKFSDTVSADDVNILVEIQISQKLYKDAINVLRKYGKVSFFTFTDGVESIMEELEENSLKHVNKCSVPPDFPIDLRVKLAVILLYLNGSHLVDDILTGLCNENIEEVGDLYLDLAEAYMETGQYSKSEPLLANLVTSENYNLAAVWLRYGECLYALGKVEDAAKAYNKVVLLAPNHADARMCLSTLLQQMGRTDEAIDVVSSQEMNGILSAQLTLQRCNLLQSQENHEEFLNTAKLLLDLVMPCLATNEEVSVILNNSNAKHRLQALREIQRESGLEAWSPSLKESDVSFNDLWELYNKVCVTMFDRKLFKDLEHFTLRALASQPLTKSSDKQKEAEFMCLLACYFNKNAKYGYHFIRDLVVEQVNCNRAWNLFGQLVAMAQDIRHNRFCLRFVLKQRDNTPLLLLNGHNALVSGSYKHALSEYVELLKSNLNDPFLYLMIGLTYTHMACQKFAANKHNLVAQAAAFLHRYYTLRGECQESLYNIGRAMHQLGLTYIAVNFYERALKIGPCIKNDPDKIFDLSCEIAYNLSVIYRTSECEELIHLKCKQLII